VKICRYERDWASHWGIVEAGAVHELGGDPYGQCEPGRRVAAYDEASLLALCAPETIWSLGANYPSRCAERGFELPARPAFAVVPGSSICGTGAKIRIPEFETRGAGAAAPTSYA
jgi:hypothetical protein